MKYTKLFILIFIFYLPNLSIAQKTTTKVIKPKNAQTTLKTIISGKSKSYYPLNYKEASIISVKGPGKLKIITRVQFTASKSDYLDYNLYYRIDGANKIKVEYEDVQKSESARYNIKSFGNPGVGKTLTLEFGLGEHTLEIWTGAKLPNVAARYLFRKSKVKKIDWVPLSPLYPKEPVDLISGEEISHYFRFSKSKPLRVKINGPTILRVLTRVENHYYMKGMINYRIQVSENGKIKNTYRLCSNRSEITSYKKGGKIIPGKAKEIVINVPRGSHSYKIIPLDEDKKTILGRVLFPKKDIKLED